MDMARFKFLANTITNKLNMIGFSQLLALHDTRSELAAANFLDWFCTWRARSLGELND